MRLGRKAPPVLPTPMSAAERELWAQVGAHEATPAQVEAVNQRKHTLIADLRERSYTSIAELTQAMHRTSIQVDRMLADGQLFAVPLGTEVLYPAWQLAGSDPIPHLGDVLTLLRTWNQPLLVDAWFVTPSIDLELHGLATAPSTWLRLGRDPAPVLFMAGSPGG